MNLLTAISVSIIAAAGLARARRVQAHELFKR